LLYQLWCRVVSDMRAARAHQLASLLQSLA
jgi:hypothetical protein